MSRDMITEKKNTKTVRNISIAVVAVAALMITAHIAVNGVDLKGILVAIHGG